MATEAQPTAAAAVQSGQLQVQPRSGGDAAPSSGSLPSSPTPSIRSSSSSKSRHKYKAMEARLHKHMDREDNRVKVVTEGILYHLLPTLLTATDSHYANTPGGVPVTGYVQVAAATLGMSCLMNSPPGFIEFLLCTPWHQLGSLQLGSHLEDLIQALNITPRQRAEVLNTPLPAHLIPSLINFMYQERFELSLPPMMVLTHDGNGNALRAPQPLPSLGSIADGKIQQLVVRTWAPMTTEIAAAVLDGATALHCAAMRGNPAQIDHLLYCNAKPTIKTSAGLLPLELIPPCGDRDSNGYRICRCMNANDEEVWECRSRISREMMMQAMLKCFSSGFWSWVSLSMHVAQCWLGLWGMSKTVYRPTLAQYMALTDLRKSAAERESALAQVQKVTNYVMQARVSREKAREMVRVLLSSYCDPDEAASGQVNGGSDGCDGAAACAQNGVRKLAVLRESAEATDLHAKAMDAADRSLANYYNAVQVVLRLAHSGYLMWPEQVRRAAQHQADAARHGSGAAAPPSAASAASAAAAAAAHPRIEHLMPVSEQAVILLEWVESVLLKLRLCSCMGCSALALRAVQIAHRACTQSFESVSKHQSGSNWQAEWENTGRALVGTVQAHVLLFLILQAHASPNKDRLFVGMACVEEWESLHQAGLTSHLSQAQINQAAALKQWVMAAHSDLVLAEALAEKGLLNSCEVIDVVEELVVMDVDGRPPRLNRPFSATFVASMQHAIDLASHASPHLLIICRSIMDSAKHHLELQERLKLLSVVDVNDSKLGSKLQDLEAVLAESEAVEGLNEERSAAVTAGEELRRRVTAQQRLEETMQSVRAVNEDSGTSPGVLFTVDWEERCATLQAVMADSEECRINTKRAKRLLKELQAYAAIAQALRALDVVMAKVPCGTSALRGALTRLEDAAAALPTSPTPACVELPGGVLVTGRVAEARVRLDVERANETLAREVRAVKTVEQLPRLEAAILAAKKVGADTLEPETYKQAGELREKFAHAFRLKSQVDNAVKALERLQRKEEADALEALLATVSEAHAVADLLADVVKAARKKLEQWSKLTGAEAKLHRALRSGVTTAALSRAIQEAAAAGVKVAAAKRTLKVLQNLEAAVAQFGDAPDPSHKATLQNRIQAAEAMDVASPLLSVACLKLRELSVVEAREALESALNHQTSAMNINVQHTALRIAVETGHEVLSEARIVQYLIAQRTCHPDAAVPLLPLLEEMAAQQQQAGSGAMSASAACAPGAAPSTDAGSNEVDDSGVLSASGDANANGEERARRRALATGCLRLVEMQEEEVIGLLEGVEEAKLNALCAQVDELVVLVGRALAESRNLEQELKRIEAEKAEMAKAKREAQEREQQARREREESERLERERLEAERKAEKDAARQKKAALAAAQKAATAAAKERERAAAAEAALSREHATSIPVNAPLDSSGAYPGRDLDRTASRNSDYVAAMDTARADSAMAGHDLGPERPGTAAASPMHAMHYAAARRAGGGSSYNLAPGSRPPPQQQHSQSPQHGQMGRGVQNAYGSASTATAPTVMLRSNQMDGASAQSHMHHSSTMPGLSNLLGPVPSALSLASGDSRRSSTALSASTTTTLGRTNLSSLRPPPIVAQDDTCATADSLPSAAQLPAGFGSSNSPMAQLRGAAPDDVWAFTPTHRSESRAVDWSAPAASALGAFTPDFSGRASAGAQQQQPMSGTMAGMGSSDGLPRGSDADDLSLPARLKDLSSMMGTGGLANSIWSSNATDTGPPDAAALGPGWSTGTPSQSFVLTRTSDVHDTRVPGTTATGPVVDRGGSGYAGPQGADSHAQSSLYSPSTPRMGTFTLPTGPSALSWDARTRSMVDAAGETSRLGALGAHFGVSRGPSASAGAQGFSGQPGVGVTQAGGGELLSAALERLRTKDSLNVNAREFQIRRPQNDPSDDLGLPNELLE